MAHLGDWMTAADGEALTIGGFATAQATGPNAAASVSMMASVQSDGSEASGEVWIAAEAEADAAAGVSVSAETDAEAIGEGFDVTEEHVETEVGGDRPTATSFTHLRATSLDIDAIRWWDGDDGGATAKLFTSLDDWLS